ncbi:MAG: argininosuccinate lyase [Firmicutes bacterium]|uniref:Argininosuccinate lyase n=1 Tax=Melghirimyces thermohalophilus TaxID=1236220 RepID=A0A1G6QR25_9BACL|nr:argininosuccinate lyase [Melghirimyces thermohalophilus]MDA8354612.1 argininosuccinate lyase [Bacillota bacterium]SDC94743.1 argininosuccinate lyase [Melghirimyces thermohalophilus]
MKLWGGRFTKPTNRLVEEYTASIDFDQKLYEEDIRGSLAHVRMLGACGILQPDEVDAITAGLKTIREKIRAGEVTFDIAHEDIHMNIEKMLIEEVGPVGGKLHTGRSRNDQVALDMHLYVRARTLDLVKRLTALREALIAKAEAHVDTILPGYTHLQRAQPVRLAHHLLAYVDMFGRDAERLMDSYKRVNTMPLGAGAIAGTTFPIQRELVAEELGFERLYDNSMDAVSDRDYLVEFLSAASLIMVHLSRLSEELILWSSEEFGYVELDDAFCTGSSMMPQKKNPDVPELIRGKTGRVVGHWVSLVTTLKALPLTYNKDMQEDKEGIFDTVETLDGALALTAPMVAEMKVNADKMRENAEAGFSNATDLADYLVTRGLSFREAHEVVGRLVLSCLQQGKSLTDLTLDQFQQACPAFEADVFDKLLVENVADARKAGSGTAKERVVAVLDLKKKEIDETLHWLKTVNS